MKKPNIYLFTLLAALFFTSCQSVYFTETQPKGNPQLSEMPEELRGNYLVMEGALEDIDMFYHVHKQGFILYQESKASIHTDSLEKEGMYVKDSLVYIKDSDIPEGANGFPYTIKDDTLYATWYSWEEKLLGDELKVTEDKGKYYLNMLEEEKGVWECAQIDQLRNQDLLIWSIDAKEEKSLHNRILGSKKLNPDSDSWLASPSKRKFRKYVKAGGFGELTHFLHKLNQNDLPDLMATKIRDQK